MGDQAPVMVKYDFNITLTMELGALFEILNAFRPEFSNENT